MKITDARAFHHRLDPVLWEGHARVDRPLEAPPLASLLTVVGADGVVCWITYQIDKAAAWVLGIREPGGVPEPVTGVGCDQVGSGWSRGSRAGSSNCSLCPTVR